MSYYIILLLFALSVEVADALFLAVALPVLVVCFLAIGIPLFRSASRRYSNVFAVFLITVYTFLATVMVFAVHELFPVLIDRGLSDSFYLYSGGVFRVPCALSKGALWELGRHVTVDNSGAPPVMAVPALTERDASVFDERVRLRHFFLTCARD